MKIIAEPHTHSIASGHAYSTIRENAEAAAKLGVQFLCNTEHTGLMLGAPNDIFFKNPWSFPKKLAGVHILNGCEANIIDWKGQLDMPSQLLDSLEWVIASMHIQVLQPGTVAQHTEAWLAVAENPLVDVIGHCGNPLYEFDYETVVKAFGEGGKIVEINSHSLGSRKGSEKNCKTVAELCKKYAVPVVVSTDAHSEVEIGNYAPCVAMLKEIDFPEELVLNADSERFAKVLEAKTGRSFSL